jgi:hypothetical protein
LAAAAYLPPVSGRPIIYHFLTEGRAYAKLGSGRREDLQAGDIVIFPHGVEHFRWSAGKIPEAAAQQRCCFFGEKHQKGAPSRLTEMENPWLMTYHGFTSCFVPSVGE